MRTLAKYSLGLLVWLLFLLAVSNLRASSAVNLGQFVRDLTPERKHALLTASLGLLGQVLFAVGSAGVVAVLLAWAVAVKWPRAEAPVLTMGVILKATPLVIVLPMLSSARVLPYPILSQHAGLIGGVLLGFFPALVEAIAGLNAAPRDLLEYYRRSVGVRAKILAEIRLRFAAAYLIPALKVTYVLCVVGVLVGQMLLPNEGSLGEILSRATNYTDTTLQFVGLIIASAAGLLGFALLEVLDNAVGGWRQQAAF